MSPKAWAPMELCSFRIFIDIILDRTAEFFCQDLHILYGYCFPERCIQECTAQDVIYVLVSLLVPSKGPWITIQTGRLLTALRVPCITKWRGKELLKLLCCNLSCDVVGEARTSHLGPLSAYFPGKWHFLLLSYLPAKLWPVLLLTLVLVLPKADLATKAHVPPPLLLHSGSWNGDCSCFGGWVPGIYWQF